MPSALGMKIGQFEKGVKLTEVVALNSQSSEPDWVQVEPKGWVRRKDVIEAEQGLKQVVQEVPVRPDAEAAALYEDSTRLREALVEINKGLAQDRDQLHQEIHSLQATKTDLQHDMQAEQFALQTARQQRLVLEGKLMRCRELIERVVGEIDMFYDFGRGMDAQTACRQANALEVEGSTAAGLLDELADDDDLSILEDDDAENKPPACSNTDNTCDKLCSAGHGTHVATH